MEYQPSSTLAHDVAAEGVEDRALVRQLQAAIRWSTTIYGASRAPSTGCLLSAVPLRLTQINFSGYENVIKCMQLARYNIYFCCLCDENRLIRSIISVLNSGWLCYGDNDL